jgi:23S rRNA pseudouridine1911/1915/1917 synthase
MHISIRRGSLCHAMIPSMTDARWLASPADEGLRLDKFLAGADRLASRARAVTALERGKVYLNDREATLADAGRRLSAGDQVRVWHDRPGSGRRKRQVGASPALNVVFEDDHMLAVNKPAGVLTVPLERNPGVPSIYDLILERLRSHGKRKPLVVHRIDQDTSGLVLFAKTSDAQRRLKLQFKKREPERVYLAVVYGRPDPPEGTWRDVLVWDEKALIQKATHPRDPRGQAAVSRYRTLEAFRDASLIEVRLETGRRNQIRIQARLRGHTLVGEERYVYGPETLRPVRFSRQALHAFRLGLTHPVDETPLTLEAPLPADLEDLLDRLRG